MKKFASHYILYSEIDTNKAKINTVARKKLCNFCFHCKQIQITDIALHKYIMHTRTYLHTYFYSSEFMQYSTNCNKNNNSKQLFSAASQLLSAFAIICG